MDFKIIVLLKSNSAYLRVTKNVSEEFVSPYLVDMIGLHQFVKNYSSVAFAIVDPNWLDYNDALILLQDFQIPIVHYEGQAKAQSWIQSFLTDGTIPHPMANQDKQNKPSQDENETKPELPLSEIDITDLKSDKKPIQDEHHAPLLRRVSMLENPVAVESDDSKIHIAGTQPVTEIRYIDRVVEREVPIYIESSTTVQPNIELFKPRLIVVVSWWPNAGSTFLSMSLAHMLSEVCHGNGVTLIEAPNQTPRHWETLDCSFELMNLNQHYQHWSEAFPGTTIRKRGINLVPLPPNMNQQIRGTDFLQYIHRLRREPFVVVDLGPTIPCDDLLYAADDVFLVFDSDPIMHKQKSLLPEERTYWQRFRTHWVYNKWFRFADIKLPGVEDFTTVPFISPEHVHKTIWSAKYPTEDDTVMTRLEPFRERFVSEWVPATSQGNTTKRRLWRFHK